MLENHPPAMVCVVLSGHNDLRDFVALRALLLVHGGSDDDMAVCSYGINKYQTSYGLVFFTYLFF